MKFCKLPSFFFVIFSHEKKSERIERKFETQNPNLRVFPKEVNATFGVLPQVQKFAKNANLTLAIPEIVYGSHDSKGTIKNQYFS